MAYYADIAMLPLHFPELKNVSGPVADTLNAVAAEPGDIAAWNVLVAQEIQPPDEDDEFVTASTILQPRALL